MPEEAELASQASVPIAVTELERKCPRRCAVAQQFVTNVPRLAKHGDGLMTSGQNPVLAELGHSRNQIRPLAQTAYREMFREPFRNRWMDCRIIPACRPPRHHSQDDGLSTPLPKAEAVFF